MNGLKSAGLVPSLLSPLICSASSTAPTGQEALNPFTRHGGRAGEYLLRLEIKQILCPPFDFRSNGQRLAKKDRTRPVRIEAHR
jgi:hypothetical protein